jgi:hypothetical protein
MTLFVARSDSATLAEGLWRIWLRQCATNLKVVGSIPDGVTGIFHCRNPSGYGSGVDSASNRNEYQECFLEGKGGRCLKLTTLPASYRSLGHSTSWNIQGLYNNRPIQGLFYLYLYLLRWAAAVVSMLASGTQVRGFKPGWSLRIFRAKKFSACLPSEGK